MAGVLLGALLLVVTVTQLVVAEAQGPSTVLKISIEGYIGRAVADYVKTAVDESRNRRDVVALLVTLNTPGGEVAAMEDIVESLLESPVPVITYVYPTGAKALSAGAYILQAGDIAAMAPYTITGAGQPVLGLTPINETKFVNPLVARMRVLMEMRNRNSTLAEKVILSNLVMSSDEAYEMGFIDVVADSEESLLVQVDGWTITKNGVNITLDTGGSRVESFEMGLRHMVLSLVSDPVINALLFTVGFIALVYGLTTPGLGAEVAGGIMVILALLGAGIDINLGSVLLMVLGAALLAYELTNPGFGVAGIGGVISLVLGALLLAVKPFSPILVETGYLITIAISVFIAATGSMAFFGVVFYKGIKAIRMKPSYVYNVVGSVGRAVDDIPEGGEGYVVVRGEYWRAKSLKQVKAGGRVRVVDKKEGFLIVEPEA